jgi:hypothetical protein
MAMKKSTPGTRSRRSSEAPPPGIQFEALREHIEEQRIRLMDAEAVLDCLICAINDDERLDASAPSYPSVFRIVRELVRSANDGLDSVNVRAAMARDVSAETLAEQGTNSEVREAAAEYVHLSDNRSAEVPNRGTAALRSPHWRRIPEVPCLVCRGAAVSAFGQERTWKTPSQASARTPEVESLRCQLEKHPDHLRRLRSFARSPTQH